MKATKIIVYGYGNPGRQDDGLGVALAENIEKWVKENNLENIFTDSNYQLNIEDAEIISNYDIVIFADASTEPDVKDIAFTEVETSDASIEFTMHAVSPAFVVDLCNKIYHRKPKTFLLHIKGYEWELSEGITDKGTQNLTVAIGFLRDYLKKNSV